MKKIEAIRSILKNINYYSNKLIEEADAEYILQVGENTQLLKPNHVIPGTIGAIYSCASEIAFMCTCIETSLKTLETWEKKPKELPKEEPQIKENQEVQQVESS